MTRILFSLCRLINVCVILAPVANYLVGTRNSVLLPGSASDTDPRARFESPECHSTTSPFMNSARSVFLTRHRVEYRLSNETHQESAASRSQLQQFSIVFENIEILSTREFNSFLELAMFPRGLQIFANIL